MKNNILRISSSLAALLVILAATSQAAAVVSWNVDANGTITGANQVAGVVPAANWNDSWLENGNTGSFGNPITINDLIDNSGAATTVDVTYVSWNFWSVQGSTPGQDADGTYNRNLLNGYLNAGPAGWNPPVAYSSVALSEIPYAQYDLYVYFNADVAGRTGTINDGTTTYDFSTLAGPSVSGANAVFTQTTSTAGNYPGADYAVFSGLSGSTQTLFCNPLVNDAWLGIAGVQLVQVPEPSTIILLSIAGLALLLVRRRS